MSFANVPLQLLKTPPQNVLSSALGGVTGGLSAMQKLHTQNLLNRINQAKAAIAPQTAQAGLQKQLLANKIQQAIANLAPQTARAQLLEAQAKPGLTRAQAALAKAQIPATPYKAVGAYLAGLGRMGQTSLSGNPSYIMARMINSPALLAMASKNKEFAKNLGTTMQKLAQQSAQQGLPGQGIAQAAPAMLQQAGGTPQTQDIYNQLMPPEHHAQNQINPDTSAILQHTQNANNWNDKDVSDFQQSLSDALLKKTTTANIMNQRQYAGVLDNLFNNADNLMPSVVKYAGFKGKTKKGLDAFSSSMGSNSPDYQNYILFTRTQAPLISNEMRRTLGGRASEYEQRAMKNISNPVYWDSNPETAMKQWKFLVNTYRHTVNPALMAHPSQIVNRFGNTQPFVSRAQEEAPVAPSPTAAPSQEDLEFTAKTRGITVQEVKRRLGIK